MWRRDSYRQTPCVGWCSCPAVHDNEGATSPWARARARLVRSAFGLLAFRSRFQRVGVADRRASSARYRALIGGALVARRASPVSINSVTSATCQERSWVISAPTSLPVSFDTSASTEESSSALRSLGYRSHSRGDRKNLLSTPFSTCSATGSTRGKRRTLALPRRPK